MQMSIALKKKIAKAVETSMRIEGYRPCNSKELREQAKTLMAQRNVKISVPGK